MPDFNRVRPFRFWCQKVLPLVYDDSLSYYELLNKVVDYLNSTIEDVNSVIQLTEDFTEEQSAAYAEFTGNINQTVDDLTDAFNTLHDFVDEYFDNLDVQEQIDNKLDEMVIDGTLYNMFAPIAEDAVPSLVTQWLNEHITPTSPPVDRTLTVSGAAADSKVVGTNFDDLKQRMTLEEEWEIPITFEDLIQGGYNNDGSVNAQGTNYLRTPQMIPIYPGMSMHFKGGAVIDRMMAGYFDPVTRLHDSTKDIAWFTGERTVTFDTDGLIIPLFRRAANTEVVPTDFDAEFELISETKTRIESRVLYKNSGEVVNGDIGSGTGLECNYSIQPRKNLVIAFSGKIPAGSTFTNLEIGLKSGSTKYNKIVIDSQNATFTTMLNTEVTKPHGLTITKNIQVTIKTVLENKAIVHITSNGNSVDLEFTPYQQWRIATAYAETSGSLTVCTLSCVNQDIAKPIWYFGDSYTAYASNRWPYYADKWVNNILLDGYGGETSNYVITAFETYLTSGYPQYAVFATGMNDGSDTDASTPNADWLSAVEEFIEICKDNQIIPILCTVPTIPSVNNNGKNVYVRTSGYWYIDFAKAVGADGTGAWYAGMLGTDNIHPTVAGAKALCAQIEADFPEVFIQGVETDRSLSRYGVAADAGETGKRLDDVGTEISGLREDLTNYEVLNDNRFTFSKNLFDSASALNNYYISSSNGNLVAYNGWFATQFIPVDDTASYSFLIKVSGQNWSKPSGVYYAFYDASQNFTHGGMSSANTDIATQTGDAYFRGSYYLTSVPTTMIGTSTDMSDYVGTDDAKLPFFVAPKYDKDQYDGLISILAEVAKPYYSLRVAGNRITTYQDGFLEGAFVKFESITAVAEEGFKTKTWSDFKTDIANDQYATIATAYDGTADVLRLLPNYGIIYNYTTNTYHVKHKTYITGLTKHDCVLFFVDADSTPHGVLYDAWVGNHKEGIARYIRTIESKETDLLNYGDNFVFAFATDCHWYFDDTAYHNYTNEMIEELRRCIGFDCYINGGDSIYYGTKFKLNGVACMNKAFEVDHDDYIYCIGNHDYNGVSGQTQNTDWMFTADGVESMCLRKMKNIVRPSGARYYYRDFEAKKMRVIVLDTSDLVLSFDDNGDITSADPLTTFVIRQSQLDWLCEVLDCPAADWGVVVVMHVGVYLPSEGFTDNNKLNNREAVISILKAYANKASYSYSTSGTYAASGTGTFATAKGSLVGAWSGHAHADAYCNTDGFNAIQTECGYPDTASRVVGTIDEICVDCVCVNKSAGTITIKRFGSGSDRSYTF